MNRLIILVLSGLLTGVSTAQINPMTPTEEAKSNYVTNQDYLSSSTLKDYRSFYGDSLKGFDEAAIKAKLLGQNVYGQEYLGYIARLKREFVNQKYKIGPAFAPPAPQVAPLPPPPVQNGKSLGGGGQINAAPCVNEDFEATAVGYYTGTSQATAVAGWTISGAYVTSCSTPGWTLGAG